MRIAELADLTETTVRTIRYYHQIGLLAVPGSRDGHRDYDLSHLARLVRIRWLARAGIPLDGIATLFSPPAESGAVREPVSSTALIDLRAAVTAVDEQIRLLQSQRDRLTALISSVERDGNLSPMPAPVVRFYEHMHEQAADSMTRRVIARERDFMELAFYRGDMPPESAVVYEGLTAAGLAESSTLFDRIADRVQRGDRLSEQEMDEIAGQVVGRVSRHVGADLPRMLRSIDLIVARRAVDLYVRLAEPAQQPVARVIGAAILSMIEKEQAI
ncbi:MerR family transcriptional regulator [Actinoplanes sp. NPDC026670]|uniref:MerR family transcriptional regulator n=1 Tax=Actinoplanes sp. NPDC026670 TaxID=3154700 RepID=UPI0034021C32